MSDCLWRCLTFLALTLAMCAMACEPKDAASGQCAPAASGAAVDRAMIAFLSKAKASHHKADLAEDGGDKAGAIAALRSLIDGPKPGGEPPAIEVREVVADSRARLAGLLSASGRNDQAEVQLRRGLSELSERNLYRGRLMEMLGVVEEARYRKLKQDGEDQKAKQAKARAVRAFSEAIAIQDEVIQRLLPTPRPAVSGSPAAF